MDRISNTYQLKFTDLSDELQKEIAAKVVERLLEADVSITIEDHPASMTIQIIALVSMEARKYISRIINDMNHTAFVRGLERVVSPDKIHELLKAVGIGKL